MTRRTPTHRRTSTVSIAVPATLALLALPGCSGGTSAPSPGAPSSLVAAPATSDAARSHATTGDEGESASEAPDTSDTTTSSAATTATALPTQDRSDAVNRYSPPAPVATALGSVEHAGQRVPVRIEVLALDARSRSTVMRLRIVPSREIALTTLPWSPSAVCMDGVKLVDPGARRVYSPAVALSHTVAADRPDCFTAHAPGTLSPRQPGYFFAYYGPLPATLSRATLRVQGFRDTSVPVRRA